MICVDSQFPHEDCNLDDWTPFRCQKSIDLTILRMDHVRVGADLLREG
jgi:hypothetical protein